MLPILALSKEAKRTVLVYLDLPPERLGGDEWGMEQGHVVDQCRRQAFEEELRKKHWRQQNRKRNK